MEAPLSDRPRLSGGIPIIGRLRLREGLQNRYGDILGPAAWEALEALSGFEAERRRLMASRIERRATRIREGRRIDFLPPDATIGGTDLTVAEARAGGDKAGARQSAKEKKEIARREAQAKKDKAKADKEDNDVAW